MQHIYVQRPIISVMRDWIVDRLDCQHSEADSTDIGIRTLHIHLLAEAEKNQGTLPSSHGLVVTCLRQQDVVAN